MTLSPDALTVTQEELEAAAIATLHRFASALHKVGVRAGELDQHGELELILTIDEHKGSCWISREMWLAIGEKAGWLPA